MWCTPAISDVIGPAVAADDPDAATNEVVDDGQKIPCGLAIDRGESFFQERNARTLHAEFGLVYLGCLQNRSGQFPSDGRRKLAPKRGRKLKVFVCREAKTEAELGIIFEQRVGPRGPAPVAVLSPGRHGQAAAID